MTDEEMAEKNMRKVYVKLAKQMFVDIVKFKLVLQKKVLNKPILQVLKQVD